MLVLGSSNLSYLGFDPLVTEILIIETSQLNCRKSQMAGLYLTEKFVVNGSMSLH